MGTNIKTIPIPIEVTNDNEITIDNKFPGLSEWYAECLQPEATACGFECDADATCADFAKLEHEPGPCSAGVYDVSTWINSICYSCRKRLCGFTLEMIRSAPELKSLT